MSRAEADVSSDEFFALLDWRASVGAKITKVIAVISIALAVADVAALIIIFGFDIRFLFKLVIWPYAFCRLYAGRRRARIQYCIAEVASIFVLVMMGLQLRNEGVFMALSHGLAAIPLKLAAFWYSVASAALYLVFFIILVSSKSVQEYMDRHSID